MVLLEDVSGQETKIQQLFTDETICAERGESEGKFFFDPRMQNSAETPANEEIGSKVWWVYKWNFIQTQTKL